MQSCDRGYDMVKLETSSHCEISNWHNPTGYNFFYILSIGEESEEVVTNI